MYLKVMTLNKHQGLIKFSLDLNSATNSFTLCMSMPSGEYIVLPYLTQTHSQTYMHAQQFNHKSLAYLSDIQPGNAQQPICHMWPDSLQQYPFSPYRAICLFVYSTSEVKFCPGCVKAPTHRPSRLTEVGILLCTFLCIHHSSYTMYLQPTCTVSLGLVSLQISFGKMGSWLVCSILAIC